MKIVIAGNWGSRIHEEPLKKALEQLGCTVFGFAWRNYFSGLDEAGVSQIKKLIVKAQYKFNVGSIVHKLNQELVEFVASRKPDVLFVYRGILIRDWALKKIKADCGSTLIVSYNNDNPFSPAYTHRTWKHFRKAIPEYDIIFSYRPSNISEYYKHNGKNVCLLPPWYVPELNHPVGLTESDKRKYGADIVFVGHYEQDNREKIFERLIEENIKFKIFGPEWDRAIKRNKLLSRLLPIRYLHGEEYNKALCASKIALCIYSTLNHDTYTRRCFEIPATKTFMLAQRSKDMERFYVDRKEAVFFDGTEDMIKKMRYYLIHEDERKEIAMAGYERVRKSGYDVLGRAKNIIKTIEEAKRKCKISQGDPDIMPAISGMI